MKIKFLTKANKKLALENQLIHLGYNDEELDLIVSFEWEKSPQGHKFWKDKNLSTKK